MKVERLRQLVAEREAAARGISESIGEATEITDTMRAEAATAVEELRQARADLQAAEELNSELEVARAASEIAVEAASAAAPEMRDVERVEKALRNPENQELWRSTGEMNGRSERAIEISLQPANAYRDAIRAGVTGEQIIRAAERSQLLVQQPDGDMRTVNIGTDGQGGYLVPTTLSTEMIRQMFSVPSLRTAGCRIIRTSDGQDWSLTISTLDPTSEVNTTDPTSNLTAESGAYDSFQPTWDRVTFKAYKTTATVAVTTEALQDSQFDIGSQIGMLGGEILSAKEAYLTMRGDGANEHEGLIGNSSVGDTDVAANNVIAYSDLDALLKTFRGRKAAYRSNLKFMMDLTDLDTILQQVGNNYGFLFGYTDANASSYRRIPAVDSIYLQDNGTAGNVIAVLADFNRLYAIREVQSVRVMVNPYIRMGNGEIVYYLDYRSDGKVLDTRAGQFLDGIA